MYIENGVTVKFSDSNEGYYSSLIGNGCRMLQRLKKVKVRNPIQMIKPVKFF